MLAKFKGIETKWIAAFVSCLLMMVQGDVTAIDVPHWIKAAKTATSASVIFLTFAFLPKLEEFVETRIGNALTFGGGVFVSDLWVHPTHFLFPTAEAITTALCSGAIIYLFYGRIER